MVELSDRTEALCAQLFAMPFQDTVRRTLREQVATDIPIVDDPTPVELERIRFSVIKLAAQHPLNLESAAKQAHTDWRDLFMMAGFGYSTYAHNEWYNHVMRHPSEPL